MSKQAHKLQTVKLQPPWGAGLLEEMRREYWADPELTEEEKRYLDSMEHLSDDEWEPIECNGPLVSEIVIEDRGPR